MFGFVTGFFGFLSHRVPRIFRPGATKGQTFAGDGCYFLIKSLTMERSTFLKIMGTGAVLACAGCGLVGCSGEDEPSPVGNAGPVDFTLDLTVAPNGPLNNVGGSLTTNGIIIARLSTTEVVALSQACTHQGTTIQFRPSSGDFRCPNHGSQFSSTGTVTQGPATRPLRRYNTELTGTSLRVFS